jgi:undecaprenyl-diphosphatase
MTEIQALILGIVQGLTEFLPVSSSTHLALARHWMGIEPNIYFDLLCHLGTLCAVVAVLWKEVWAILKSVQSMALFTVALLPLIPAYLLFKPLRILFAHDAGFFLLAMSALLFIASRVRRPANPSKWRAALWIGAAQGLALLPGFSRSGATISTARLLGWPWQEAARFSFLLSIPTILGGSVLETIASSHDLTAASWNACAIGALASFVVGMGAVRLLFWILDRGTLLPFAWYCLAAGVIAIFGLR